MYAAAREAQKGVATVTAVLAEWDWSMEAAGGQPSVTGAVTADNGQELLILADNSVCSGAQAWTVTFSDGTVHDAALKKQDANIGLAIFSVPRTDITDATWNAVKVCNLGTSNMV